MHIDIKVLILRPTFINASEPLPVFISYPQPRDESENSPTHRKLTLTSLLRALFGLAFWWVVIGLCVRLI
jgi:hypothetical protein